MDIILKQAIPLSILLALTLLCYVGEFLAKKKLGQTRRGALLAGVCTVVALLSNTGMIVTLLMGGGSVEEILPVLLLSLFGALL